MFIEVYRSFLLLNSYFHVLALLTKKQMKEARAIIEATQDSFLHNILLSLYHEFSQKLSVSMEYAEKAWRQRGTGTVETLVGLSRILSCYFRLGRHEDALQILEQVSVPFVEDQVYWMHSIKNTEAMLHIETGNLDVGIGRAEEAVSLARKMGDKKKLGHSLNTLAVGLEWAGRIKDARRVYQTTLAVKQEIGDEVGYAITLCNLGALISNFDNPFQSEQLYLEALDIFKKHENIERMAKTHELLGFVYGKMGSGDLSISHYREALYLAQETENERLKTDCLKNVISSLAGAKKIREAEILLPQLKEIVKKGRLSGFENAITLIEATILKQKPRVSNKIRAQELYRSLLSQPPNYEIALISLTNLIDLFIMEWKTYATPPERQLVEEELHSSLDLLENQITKYQSKGLWAEFLFLKGKINCLYGNREVGIEQFHRSLKLAQEESWKTLASKITETLRHVENGTFNLSDAEFSDSVHRLTFHYPSVIPSLQENQVDQFYKVLGDRFGNK